MCLCRQLSFSSPRLLNHNHDELFPAGLGSSSHQPRSFYSASSGRLDSRQPRVTGKIHASSVDNFSDTDTRWRQLSTRGNITGRARDSRFYSDRLAPTVASTTPVQPAVREPNPVSLRHSNLPSSSDFVSSPFTNSNHTFSD